MASPGSAWSFWKTMRAVSPKTIEEEAALPFRLALVGDPASAARLREVLLTPKATEAERGEAEIYLAELPAPPDADAAKAFDFVLYASGPGEQIAARGENSVPVVGLPDAVAEALIAQRPDLAVALARRLPLFRVAAANRLIQDTCRVNANFALLSALPGVFPPTAIFLPASSVADTIILTKNQLLLIMRLAALHGQKPGYTKQVKELIGTVGAALGWRTLARQIVQLVPAGVGAALKATIAYSGTLALGKAALAFYQTGRVLPAQEIRSLYKNGREEARKAVEALRTRQ